MPAVTTTGVPVVRRRAGSGLRGKRDRRRAEQRAARHATRSRRAATPQHDDRS